MSLKSEPYHVSQAHGHLRLLRERVITRLARLLAERGWTQAEAAAYLGVRQPRISDLMRGKTHKFTLDWLVQMLFALDHPVALVLDRQADFQRSWHPASMADSEEAIAYYTQIIQFDPRDSLAYARRASAYHDAGKFDLAIGDYTRCIELDPTREGYRTNRAHAFLRAGQNAAALQDCEEQLRLFPESNVYATRGLVHANMGNDEQAVADYTRSIAMDGQRPGSYFNRAHAYTRLQQYQAALADWRKVLELDPTDKTARTAIDLLEEKTSSVSTDV